MHILHKWGKWEYEDAEYADRSGTYHARYQTCSKCGLIKIIRTMVIKPTPNKIRKEL